MQKEVVEKVKGPGSAKQETLMGVLELERECLTCEYRLAVTLSFAPSINFNDLIAGFDRGISNDTQQKYF